MSYLPTETLNWCSQIYIQAGYPALDAIKASDLLPNGTSLHKAIYYHLRQAINRHLSEHQNENPVLSFLPEPRGGYR
jgi:hypothetical protein